MIAKKLKKLIKIISQKKYKMPHILLHTLNNLFPVFQVAMSFFKKTILLASWLHNFFSRLNATADAKRLWSIIIFDK